VAAVALAAGLVGYSATAGFAIPGRRHPAVQASAGTALAYLAGAPLGMRGAPLRSGIRLGAVGAGSVTGGVAVAVALPVVRAAMRARGQPAPGWRWLAVDIPLGTVWSEEMMYRAALGTVARRAFGRRTGRLLQAVAFGLSHVADARAVGEPVAATVLVTGVAGWVFGWLAERSGSVAAPVLAHLAVNEAAAVAAMAVRRRAPI
jgi:uncharacterized protein